MHSVKIPWQLPPVFHSRGLLFADWVHVVLILRNLIVSSARGSDYGCIFFLQAVVANIGESQLDLSIIFSKFFPSVLCYYSYSICCNIIHVQFIGPILLFRRFYSIPIHPPRSPPFVKFYCILGDTCFYCCVISFFKACLWHLNINDCCFTFPVVLFVIWLIVTKSPLSILYFCCLFFYYLCFCFNQGLNL